MPPNVPYHGHKIRIKFCWTYRGRNIPQTSRNIPQWSTRVGEGAFGQFCERSVKFCGTYRTLPQNVPHSPVGRPALSRRTSHVSQHIHIESPGHTVDLEGVRILDTEQDYFKRGIKEAIYIRALQPSLNRDWGRYRLQTTFGPLLTLHVGKITCPEHLDTDLQEANEAARNWLEWIGEKL
ncbi:hypothetical protein Bbelb_393330 [Branchiostoma belcheri]|nr:hypothetical protein Bbelb_393330 [Branchiostoma belcheri]